MPIIVGDDLDRATFDCRPGAGLPGGWHGSPSVWSGSSCGKYAEAELAAAGLVHRVIGVGTFVAPAKAASPLFEVRNIADEIARRGHRHRTTVTCVRRETVTSDDPLYRDRPQDSVFRSLLVHFDDDVPIQLEDRLVAPVEAPEYLQQDFAAVTPNQYLSRVAPLVRGGGGAGKSRGLSVAPHRAERAVPRDSPSHLVD